MDICTWNGSLSPKIGTLILMILGDSEEKKGRETGGSPLTLRVKAPVDFKLHLENRLCFVALSPWCFGFIFYNRDDLVEYAYKFISFFREGLSLNLLYC